MTISVRGRNCQPPWHKSDSPVTHLTHMQQTVRNNIELLIATRERQRQLLALCHDARRKRNFQKDNKLSLTPFGLARDKRI